MTTRSIATVRYNRYYTAVTYATCDIIGLDQYAMVRYYIYYTVVAYAICVMISVGR